MIVWILQLRFHPIIWWNSLLESLCFSLSHDSIIGNECIKNCYIFLLSLKIDCYIVILNNKLHMLKFSVQKFFSFLSKTHICLDDSIVTDLFGIPLQIRQAYASLEGRLLHLQTFAEISIC